MNVQKVLHDHSLTSTEKVVCMEVYTQSKMKYCCTMTNSELGRLLNVSNKTISRCLTKLHKSDYITVFTEGVTRVAKVNKN